MFPTHAESKVDGSIAYTQIETQGWRLNMEDAILCSKVQNKDGGYDDIFGIFDGHGGSMVATFCKHTFQSVLQHNLNML